MKKQICIIILLLTCGICNAQLAIEKRYITPGNGSYPIYGIASQPNGDFVVSSVNNPGAHAKIVVMRVNSNGNILWSKEYENNDGIAPYRIISNADGGNTISFVLFDLFYDKSGILRIDSLGNVLWSKVYLAANKQQNVFSINSTKDNGILIAAGRYRYSKYMGILIKTDSTGNILWTRRLMDDSAHVTIRKCIEMPSGDFLAVGHYERPHTIIHPFIWRVDSAGNSLSFKIFNYSSNFRGYSANVYPTQDSGFIFTCDFDTTSYAQDVGTISRFNKNDSLMWSKQINQDKLSFNYWSFDDRVTFLNPNEMLLTAGYLSSGTDSVSLFKMDTSGNVYWRKKIANYLGRQFRFMSSNNSKVNLWFSQSLDVTFISSDSSFSNVCYFQDDSISLSPFTLVDSLIPNLNHSPLVYDSIIQLTVNPITIIDTTLCLVLGIAENNNSQAVNIFPNPVTNHLTVALNNNFLSEIIIYDITSRKILQRKFTNSITINTEQYAKGVYIYEVRSKDGSCNKGKVVKD